MRITRRQLREMIRREISSSLNEQTGYGRVTHLNDKVTVTGSDVPSTIIGRLKNGVDWIIMSDDKESDPGDGRLNKLTAEELEDVDPDQRVFTNDAVWEDLVNKGNLFKVQTGLLNLTTRTSQRGIAFRENIGDVVHTALDILGLVPLGGEHFDMMNAALYLSEAPPKVMSSLISIVGMIPGVGDSLKVIKPGKKLTAEILERLAPKIVELIDQIAGQIPIVKKYQEVLDTKLAEIIDDREGIAIEVIELARNHPRAKKAIEIAMKAGPAGVPIASLIGESMTPISEHMPPTPTGPTRFGFNIDDRVEMIPGEERRGIGTARAFGPKTGPYINKMVLVQWDRGGSRAHHPDSIRRWEYSYP